MKPEINENCSCPETCCPSFKESDDDIKNLLRVCYIDWVIMGILAMMIMMKMETYLADDEWLSYMIYSTMLFFFSLPLTVGFHGHTIPRCNCICIRKESSIPSPIPIITSKSSKKESEFGLIKKVEDALGFGGSRDSDDKSSEESESSSSGPIVEKLRRKSKAKKRVPFTLMKKKEPKKTTVVIKEEIFKGSDAEDEEKNIAAKLMVMKESSFSGETDNFEYDMIVDVDPDEDNDMIVDVLDPVEGRGGEMTVSAHSATEEEGQAEVEAEIKYGDKKDKNEVEIVVLSDEMTLKADKKKKI